MQAVAAQRAPLEEGKKLRANWSGSWGCTEAAASLAQGILPGGQRAAAQTPVNASVILLTDLDREPALSSAIVSTDASSAG